jgi:subtilisin family serine protease
MSRVNSFDHFSLALHRTSLLAGTALAAILLAGAVKADPDPEYDAQWGLGMIGAKAAHDRGYTGAGVTVGVVDSGIYFFHPDLIANLSPISMNGPTGVAADGIDMEGHGTHVAGTIAAERNGVGMVGVAPGAKVSALQLTDYGSAGITEATLDATAARLFDHGLANGIEFYNNSWGSDPMMPSGGPELETTRLQLETTYSRMFEAIDRGIEAGNVYVWANGNDGLPSVALEPGLPHLYPELKGHWIAVAAVGQTGEITAYSNRCGIAATWCISAPGGDDDETTGGIYATANDGDYVRMSGTSMAAPHVTGALAIAREMFPNARGSDLTELIFATATDIGDTGIDEIYGWGLLNLDALTSTRDAKTGAVFSQGVYGQGRTIGQIADVAGVLGSGGTGSDGGSVTFSTYGDAPKTDFNTRWWTAPIAGLTQTSASATTASALTRTGGALIGMDFRPSQDVRFGFGLGFSETRTSSAGNKTSSTGLHALAYGGLDMDRWFIDGAAGLSHFDSSTTRSGIVGAGGGAGALTGTSKGTDIGLWSNARVGMTFQTAMAALQPYAQARIVHQWLGSTSETGAGAFALTAPSATASQTDLGAGIRLSGQDIGTSVGAIRPVFDLGYARAVGSLGDSRATTMLGAPVGASAVGIGRDIARLTAGLTYASTSGKVTGALGYSGEYRARAASHALNANVSVKF